MLTIGVYMPFTVSMFDAVTGRVVMHGMDLASDYPVGGSILHGDSVYYYYMTPGYLIRFDLNQRNQSRYLVESSGSEFQLLPHNENVILISKAIVVFNTKTAEWHRFTVPDYMKGAVLLNASRLSINDSHFNIMYACISGVVGSVLPPAANPPSGLAIGLEHSLGTELVYSSPLGRTYFGSAGDLYNVEMKQKIAQRSVVDEKDLSQGPLLALGRVFVGSTGFVVHTVDPVTSDVIDDDLQLSDCSSGWGGVRFYADTNDVYALCGSQNIYRFAKQSNGQLVLEKSAPLPFGLKSIAVGGGFVYSVSEAGTLCRISNQSFEKPLDIAPNFCKEAVLPAAALTPLLYASGTLWAGARTPKTQFIVAVDLLKSSLPAQTFEILGNPYAPFASQELVYVADDTGRLYEFDPVNRIQKKSMLVFPRLTDPGIPDVNIENTIMVFATGSGVYAVNYAAGTLLWAQPVLSCSRPMATRTLAVAVCANDIMSFDLRSGRLHLRTSALRVEKALLLDRNTNSILFSRANIEDYLKPQCEVSTLSLPSPQL